MSTAPRIDRKPRPAEPPLTLVRGERGGSAAPAVQVEPVAEQPTYAGPLGLVRKLADRFVEDVDGASSR